MIASSTTPTTKRRRRRRARGSGWVTIGSLREGARFLTFGDVTLLRRRARGKCRPDARNVPSSRTAPFVAPSRSGPAAHATPPPAADRRPPSQGASRGPFRAQSAHPGPHRPSPDGPRGGRPPDDQPPRSGVRGDARPHPRGHEAVLRHDLGCRDDLVRGLGRARGRGRQHALARRPGPRREHRLVRRPVRQDRHGLRRGRDEARCRVGLRGGTRRGPRAPALDARRQGRAADPQRDLDRGHEPHRGARRRGPPGDAGRPDPRRQRVRPGRRPLPDGRLGRRSRRHGVAEGMDGRAGPRDDRRVAAGLGGDGDRPDAALLPRPAGPSRRRDERPDPVHPGHRGRLPGRRGAAPDGRRGRREHLRAARGLCRGGPRRPRRPRLRAVRRPAPRVADRDGRQRPGRPRLEGVQHRGQATRRGPRRRPGQADRPDLPARAISARSRSRRSWGR